MRICINCGKVLSGEGKFCPYCGTETKEVIEKEETTSTVLQQAGEKEETPSTVMQQVDEKQQISPDKVVDSSPVFPKEVVANKDSLGKGTGGKTFAYCAMIAIFAVGAFVLMAFIVSTAKYVFSDKTPKSETTASNTQAPASASSTNNTVPKPSSTSASNRYSLSTTIQLQDSNTTYNVCVQDAYASVPTWGAPVIYMYCIVENTGSANGSFYSSDFVLYGDNVQLNPSTIIMLDNYDNMTDFTGGNIPPGRRLEGYLVYECKPNQYEHLELDVANGVAIYQVK